MDLEKESDKYERLLSCTGIGLYEWTDLSDPSRVTWSDHLYELYGLDRKTPACLQTVLNGLHPDDVQMLKNDVAHTLRHGEGRVTEYRFKVRGEYRWFRSKRIARLDQNGKAVSMIGSVEDVTERKRNESRLRDLNQSLESEIERRTLELGQANESKSRFLSSMSHEIRTPLGLVLGFAELLAGNTSLDTEAREYLGLIVKNGEILSRVVNDLLDLSRMEAGRLKFLYTDTNLSVLFDEVRATFQEKAAEKGLSFLFENRIFLRGTVAVDEIRLKQIIYNLLTNALKFTDRGSIRVSCSPQGPNGFVIDIVDTGIGVPDEEKERVFGEYMRSELAEFSRTAGSGLGLKLSKSLAQGMGGDVVLVASEPGKGSHFRFTFIDHHRESEAEVQRTRMESIGDRDLQGRTVYVLDDNLDNLRLAEVFLDKLGCRVKALTDPHEFIELTMKENPELVLLDILMPEMSGLEVFRILRGRGFTNAIWALTAYALNDDIQQIVEHGFDGYIRKPISLNSIRRKLLQEFTEREPGVLEA